MGAGGTATAMGERRGRHDGIGKADSRPATEQTGPPTPQSGRRESMSALIKTREAPWRSSRGLSRLKCIIVVLLTGGGAGGDGGTEDALLRGEVHLHGGVATGVVDRAGVHLLDGHLGEHEEEGEEDKSEDEAGLARGTNSEDRMNGQSSEREREKRAERREAFRTRKGRAKGSGLNWLSLTHAAWARRGARPLGNRQKEQTEEEEESQALLC